MFLQTRILEEILKTINERSTQHAYPFRNLIRYLAQPLELAIEKSLQIKISGTPNIPISTASFHRQYGFVSQEGIENFYDGMACIAIQPNIGLNKDVQLRVLCVIAIDSHACSFQ
jgi:hypothetical protein